MKKKNVLIIGAGNIGSRHLQALKKVSIPLDIIVFDPSAQSLKIAKQRYEEVQKRSVHAIDFSQNLPKGKNFDLAIIATASNVRAEIIQKLLKKNKVRHFILEKILFNKKKDYRNIEKILISSKIKAWVNCPRRMWPIYGQIRSATAGQPISLRASMGQWELACNAIHFIDLAAFLTGNKKFKLNTESLEKKLIPSRRKGFLEIRGTLSANFEDGSSCELTSYSSGNAPFLLEIFNSEKRYILKEADGKGWISDEKNNWRWKEITFQWPLVSETTALAVESILKNGTCRLPLFTESSQLHLQFLEPLQKFVNKNSKDKYGYYPFT